MIVLIFETFFCPPNSNLIASMSLQDWANVATIAGAAIATFALFYAGYQVHKNTLISRGQFWLELEKMFSLHDAVHLKLRPGGEWSSSGKGPSTDEEWAKVEDYMGLFEHCEILMSEGLIDLDTFKSIFSYRLQNIIGNHSIVQSKLCEEKESWTRFLSLMKKLGLEKPVCKKHNQNH